MKIIFGDDHTQIDNFHRLLHAQLMVDMVAMERGLIRFDINCIRRKAKEMASRMDVFGLVQSSEIARKLIKTLQADFPISYIKMQIKELKTSIDTDCRKRFIRGTNNNAHD